MYALRQQIQQFIMNRSREELFELTYAYTEIEGRYFNTTLFALYWGCTPQDSVDEVIVRVRQLVQTDLEHIASFRQCVIEHARDSVLMHKTIEYMHHVFEQIWRAVPIEAQKFWQDASYDAYDIWVAFHEIERRDELLFWSSILRSPQECAQADCLLTWIYAKNETELDEDESSRFKKYLLHMRTSIPANNEICAISSEQSLLDEDFFSVQIPRQTYMQLFTLALEAYGLSIPVINAQRWSIYDGRHALEVPEYEDYATLSLRRVIKLIAHEIETHYVVLHNTDLLLWWMKWWFSLAREEWLAKFQEFLLSWLPLAEIRVTDWLPLLLMGEILNTEQFLDFLNLYRKLHGITASGMLRLLRAKRNYPLWSPWVNHKDVTYSRWLQQIAAYVHRWWTYASLFLSKVDLDDIHAIQHQVALQNPEKHPIEPICLALRLIDRLMIAAEKQSVLSHYTTQYPFLVPLLQKPLTAHQANILQNMVTIGHEQIINSSTF